MTPGHIAVTEAGKLSAIHIIHVSSILYDKNAEEQERVINELVWKCLLKGEELGVNSISMPAFCIGHFKFPAELVVSTMLDSVQQYLLSHTETRYSEIRFASNEKAIYTLFVSEFEKKWPDSIPVSKTQKKKKNRQLSSSLTMGLSSNHKIERAVEKSRNSPAKLQKSRKTNTEIELKTGIDLEEIKKLI